MIMLWMLIINETRNSVAQCRIQKCGYFWVPSSERAGNHVPHSISPMNRQLASWIDNETISAVRLIKKSEKINKCLHKI